MIGSSEINRVIRDVLSPVLRENGFSRVQARNAWGWHDECIWVLNLRAVGSYFSAVTGWPPMSVEVQLGVYCEFLPPTSGRIKQDIKGELLPTESQCHEHYGLSCWLDQEAYTGRLDNPAEQKRSDLWWIEPDGSNLLAVVEDFKKSFLGEGLSWLKRNGSRKAIEDRQREKEEFFRQFPELRDL